MVRLRLTLPGGEIRELELPAFPTNIHVSHNLPHGHPGGSLTLEFADPTIFEQISIRPAAELEPGCIGLRAGQHLLCWQSASGIVNVDAKMITGGMSVRPRDQVLDDLEEPQ